ncbi:hypothetical protein Rumeso_03273 [Rubellimicrobium mesophilum DSM 19309]|uniref:DUF4236 domain-containing protein n=1 Tax=Rubellimicrobium mesophilum DSM 19309 TaxID=442562 RepID=A0A017HL10_9RHOB|nr:DUF4236 domain-containing protein [Rubellimicrobium mesophilum]EYD75177.1 hypothetical protein Rumeso_03273 [Rubellimicrobium mesophilum DSM 19309]
MGFRFQRSLRLAPGLRLNLSKSGVSATLGRPGASVNLSRRGVEGSAGLPGTGLSYRQRVAGRSGISVAGAVLVLVILAVWLLA